MISGASLVLGGTLVGQVSKFVFNAVGAHALGPAHYGVLAASMALISFATPLLAALQAVASREATSLAARNELRKIGPMLRHYGLRVTGGVAGAGRGNCRGQQLDRRAVPSRLAVDCGDRRSDSIPATW